MKNVLFAFCIATFLVSCGGEKKVETSALSTETTEIKGALTGCYEVIKKVYVLDESGYEPLISVDIKRTAKVLHFEADKARSFSVSEDGKPTQVGFGIELLDDKGNVVEVKNATEGGIGGIYSSEDIDAALQLNSGETCVIRWSLDKEKNPVSFRITSAVESRDTSASATNETINETESSSNDWDAVLDEYEDYIDKYIEFYKKAKAGDMSAATEYASMLESAQSLAEKLSNAQSELTPTQASRFMKLQQKLTKAM